MKLLQADLPKAKEALDTAEKLAGGGGGVREAKQKLRELMKEVRAMAPAGHDLWYGWNVCCTVQGAMGIARVLVPVPCIRP